MYTHTYINLKFGNMEKINRRNHKKGLRFFLGRKWKCGVWTFLMHHLTVCSDLLSICGNLGNKNFNHRL